MNYETNNFILRLAQESEISDLTAFYNEVIDYSMRNKSRRTLHWNMFTPESVESSVNEEELYIVSPRQVDADLSTICAAVMLDEARDAWPADEGILPRKALRFAKFAVNVALAGQQFGSAVAWPHIVHHARTTGYPVVYCEAHKIEGLDRFYTNLGMTPHSEMRYYSPYYGEKIQAYRYSVLIDASATRFDLIQGCYVSFDSRV